ncbi:UDP-N-acetylmuramoyl-tripeptide--D-alanyl-D-alanine ligase [Rubrobacter indicoceani]|uniref:UDP-N-acetylmuramoyl-tripeptide--D-alanyl-D- alanine ligase n=1 Tax=Rubrobacter indicoceani TaxID=2051957 RepID=UPI000E5A5DC9|nr:UDP-N-acetylmuramoyl-tripeptide--D-alanyl-D-alanine ligase [Rubrobacter indicoceani]
MRPVTLEEVRAATGARIVNCPSEDVVSGAAIDSREVRPGDLFFALRGRTDGALYARSAIEAGAAAVVADRPLESLPTLVVEDPLAALQSLARWSLSDLKNEAPAIVGITGTVGKTTTKDALAAILRNSGSRTFATAGNFNNEIGLPLTVLAAGPRTEHLVLEMGATHAGDITQLCSIARPSVGILTAISPVHLDSFGSLEALAEAKGELATCLLENGTLVAPSGVPAAAVASERSLARRISFAADEGISGGVDLSASGVSETTEGLRFTVEYEGRSAEVLAPVFGTHLIQPLLAAIGGGLALGLSLEECAAGAARIKRTGLRGELFSLRGDITVYDDSYNASPAAMSAVLKYGAGQAAQQERRFVAILGGMFELGSSTRAYHQEIGDVAATSGVDLLVCVGEEARWYAETFPGESVAYPDAETAAEELPGLLKPNDYVVVKGSRGIGLDRVTLTLKESLPLV